MELARHEREVNQPTNWGKIFYEKLNKFTLDDFTKGLRIFGLYIKLINYQRYSLLVNKFQ